MSEPVQQPGASLHGLSLASFLQLLEQERTSCTLAVSAGSRSGSFFFREGRLIDAVCEGKAGMAAVRLLLAMQGPSFRVAAPEDRMERVTQPLARILLHGPAADNGGAALPGGEAVIAEAVKAHPLLLRLIAEIMDLPAVRHYYLLNQKGKMIARSSDNRQLCNFISYAVMSSLQMRQSLGGEVRGPHRIETALESGGTLLILPGSGLIIGLLLDRQAAVQEIAACVRAALRPQPEKERA
jgi:hypothetical protein